MQNHSKSSTTVVMCGSAEGVLLPPYIIYKSEYLWPNWVSVTEKSKKYCASDCCKTAMRYNCSKSGWINPVIFEDWFFNHFLPHAQLQPGPKILMCDNLSSHFTDRVIHTCLENNVRFVPLLPNSTHLLQPLDVAFFRPMKVAWRKTLQRYRSANKKVKVVPKCDFPDLIHNALEEMDTIRPIKNKNRIFKERIKHNLKSAFKKAGIVPFNPEEVLVEIPGYHKNSTDPSKEDKRTCYCDIPGSKEEGALVSLLKQQRFSDSQAKKKTISRGKKLEVVPGQSVSTSVRNSTEPENEENVDDPDAVENVPSQPQPSTSSQSKISKKKLKF